MKESKRVKISFSVEAAQYTVIEGATIAKAQEIMSDAMENVIRVHQKNEALSKQHASGVVLNA